jgi:hypothetical protein
MDDTSRDATNRRQRAKAMKLMEEIVDGAMQRGAFGEFGIRIVAEDGVITRVVREIDSTDRSE